MNTVNMMKNEFILERKPPMEKWLVLATIAEEQQREELIPILKYVQENSGKPDLAKSMAGHLFFEQEARLVVAERLLDICGYFGFTAKINNRYSLTRIGFPILKSGSCPVPKYGPWKITISTDPLLPHPVLDFDGSHEEPTGFNEVRGKNRSKRNFTYIPEWFKKWCDSVSKEEYFITIHQGSKFIMHEVEDRGESLPCEVNEYLSWNVDKSCVSMRGKDVEIERKIQVSQVWNELLVQRNLIELWDGDSIASKFAEVKTEARKLMQDDFTFEAPIIEEYGTFSTFVAEGVNIRAASREDAHEWAEWRLCENVSSFACSDLYESWRASAAEPFSKFDISLPKRDQLAHKMWQEGKSKKSWHLIAASDWNL